MTPILLYSEDISDLSKGEGDPDLSVAGTGESVPYGVECLFEYNGLILNDRSVIDKYRIIRIEGLDDADVRDSRENNPSEHGETAYQAFYGGRTIILEGRVEAYELHKLRDMQEALRTAFNELEEKPLVFNRQNATLDHFIECRKSQKIQWSEEQRHLNHFFRDFQITLRASNPRFRRSQLKTATLYANHVYNPSFETNTVGQAPTWWTDQSDSQWTSKSFLVSSGWANHGTKSLRVQGTKDNNTTSRSLKVQSPTGAVAMLISPDTNYKAQAFINVANLASGTPSSDGGVRIGVSYYTSGGSLVETIRGEAKVESGEFVLELSTISRSNAARVSVFVEARSETALDVVDFYIDSIWLVQYDDQYENPQDSSISKIQSLSPSLYWPLDETNGTFILDRSGNDRNGTYQNGVLLNQDGPFDDPDSNSVEFDATNDFISSSYNVFLNGTIRTFMGWAYREDHLGDIVLFSGAGGPDDAIYLLIGGSYSAELWINGGEFPESETALWAAAFPSPLQWEHWALVIDTSGATAELYVNGISKGVKSLGDSYSASAGNLQVGARSSGITDVFDGKMAHFAVFEKRLNSDQIRDIYLTGLAAGLGPQPGVAEVTNDGNFDAQPLIRLHGDLRLVQFENESNAEEFILASATVVASATYFEADIGAHTLLDSSGSNQFANLDPTSDWLEIDSGTNSIVTQVDDTLTTATTGRVEFIFRDTWL